MKKSAQFIKGHFVANIVYPIAEYWEKRTVRKKYKEIGQYYRLPFIQRKKIAFEKLCQTIEFAKTHVPYYRDLFQSVRFDPAKLRCDPNYLSDLPYLTKDIIREQGLRLLSRPLNQLRHHVRKTGGSTGLSCLIYYDQEAIDYSAAITLYARQCVGKLQHHSELHFASRFLHSFPLRNQIREWFKCFAMNRSNIFFDSLDDSALDLIWSTLKKRAPRLVHGHPSTMYALACYVDKTEGKTKIFNIFESSGEVLDPHMRSKIADTFSCKVLDRYGLAEFGVIGYQTEETADLRVFDSEGWMETGSHNSPAEIVFTGFRNQLMPLIRYRTGDMGEVQETQSGLQISRLLGRIHDIVTLRGKQYPTHYIQDILDRIGGIQEFQIDLRQTPPRLLIVAEPSAQPNEISSRLDKAHWRDGIQVLFVGHKDLIRVGHQAKFRHVVLP
ncbi:MAG TPA: hypothetical protein VLF94_03590 [Chlamydiales bacterium]|nr:hypothetical protein [Chlamydiales bacterium]